MHPTLCNMLSSVHFAHTSIYGNWSQHQHCQTESADCEEEHAGTQWDKTNFFVQMQTATPSAYNIAIISKLTLTALLLSQTATNQKYIKVKHQLDMWHKSIKLTKKVLEVCEITQPKFTSVHCFVSQNAKECSMSIEQTL